MGMITAHRIAAALLGGSMSGAQLETLLGTTSGLAGWKFCAATQGLRDPLLTDATAKAAWMGSVKAVDAMAALSADSAAVIAAESTLMASVFNTAARADAWFASATTRAAIWNSDTALTALMASATGKARARACAKYAVRSIVGNGAEQVFPAPLGTIGAKGILVGWSQLNGSTVSFSGRKAGSTIGTLSASPVNGVTAATDNVVALEGPVKTSIPNSVQMYLGVVEV